MSFESRIDPRSDQFAENREGMLALIDRLRGLEARAEALSERRADRFAERGQITPRQRLARLLDPGMPFLRLHSIAGYMADTKKEADSNPGASIIVGIGYVAGARCMIWVDDSGIKAGAMTKMSLPVAMSAQEMALKLKLPLIHLVESAGANLVEYEVELWARGGGVFHNLARLSAAGVPVISVLHGPSTAGGAYMPGLSDYVIGVRTNGMAALAGAALVAAATGERSTDKALGGAEMHSTVSGLVDYLAEDDAHGVALAREVVGRLNWNARLNAPPPAEAPPPRWSPDELAGAIPLDYRTPYDCREIAARIVDGSDFSDFKPGFGVSTVCLQATVHGRAVGIIGNNGPIDPAGANKAAQFMQLCDQAGAPLVFLNNTTGYMVGEAYERAGMIKHGSKMIQAVSNVSVPKITFYVGASFGAGNYGMAGFAYQPDFLFAWPNAMTGVMGGEQAAKTMAMVQRASAARKGEEVDEKRMEMQSKMIAQHFDKQSDAFYTSGRVLDHGVIDPRDTRAVLGFCLATLEEAKAREVAPNSYGVARL